MNKYTLFAATTAILSAGLAMNAEAIVTDALSTSVNVHVGIAKPHSIVKAQDVDFGYILLNGALDVTMDPTNGYFGTTEWQGTPDTDPIISNLDQRAGKNGIIRVTYPEDEIEPYETEYPDEIQLKNDMGDIITYKLTVQTLKSVSFPDNVMIPDADGIPDIIANYVEYGIGGRITAPASIRSGDYKGSFTFTLLSDDGMPEDDPEEP